MSSDSLLSKSQQMLAASALIPVIGALSQPTQLQGLVYSFFVFVYLAPTLFKDNAAKNKIALERAYAAPAVAEKSEAHKLTVRKTIYFIAAVVAAGLVSETLLWISQLFAEKHYPTLMHPQLRADLFLAFAYYLALALAWLLLLKRYKYTARDLFFLSFVVALINQWQLGVLLQLCESLINSPITALLTLSSMLVAGGSVVAMGFIAGGRDFSHEKKSDMKQLLPKYLISLILIVILPETASLAAMKGGRELGLIPDKKPIWEAPFM